METFKLTRNKSKRHYTINVGYAKYRTIKMSKEEFNQAYYWTLNDWKQFLTTDEYYKL